MSIFLPGPRRSIKLAMANSEPTTSASGFWWPERQKVLPSRRTLRMSSRMERLVGGVGAIRIFFLMKVVQNSVHAVGPLHGVVEHKHDVGNAAEVFKFGQLSSYIRFGALQGLSGGFFFFGASQNGVENFRERNVGRGIAARDRDKPDARVFKRERDLRDCLENKFVQTNQTTRMHGGSY